MYVCMSCLHVKRDQDCSCPDPDVKRVELEREVLNDREYCYECELFVCKCGGECACAAQVG